MKTTSPSESDYHLLASDYDIVPLVRAVPLDSILPAVDPVLLYKSIRSGGTGFILESGKGGRRSYVGIGGRRMLESRGATTRMIDSAGVATESGDPFDSLRKAFTRETIYSHPLLPGFSGGGIGYLSYDIARHIERLPELTLDDLELPDALFIFPDDFVMFDHEEDVLYLVALLRPATQETYQSGISRLDDMEDRLRLTRSAMPSASSALSFDPGALSLSSLDSLSSSLCPEEFHRIVQQAIEYILAGDIFQVNLSIRFSGPYDDDPLLLYETLRRINPAPYMTFLEFDDHAIVGASPELLLKVRGSEMVTRPIAGTRKRGVDEHEDEEKIGELIGNEKERAEHLMLVDLERNDLGRVARYGTVRVDEFMGIEKYSHVIHIVSNVRGELAEGMDLFDAIRSVFPGGTITGAPKVRAMEIVEELEPHRRGIYTGSAGWIGFNGDVELNIAIRTMVVKDGTAYAQAGAGIVADSIPEHEYKESARKAEAALQALQQTVESL